MRILIQGYLEDLHSTIVAHALRAKGHEVCLWNGANFPTRQGVSLTVKAQGEVDWEAHGPGLDLSSAQFDVVWSRRPVPPILPKDMHSGDRIVATRECDAFDLAFWQFIAPNAFWVNPPESYRRASAKPVQLAEAARAGLKVPPTLFSNDPERIHRFIDHHEGKVVYKAFRPAQWTMTDGLALLLTSTVGLEDLPDDEILRLTPGIFQPEIPKAYELRVTCMGDFAVTAKLLSQINPMTKLDWRIGCAEVPLQPAQLPGHIEHACRKLMKRLGVVFGCLDFIVTPEGDYVFLEINEMGQFLWLEETNPDFKLLDCFCEFLVQRRAEGFSWHPSADSIAFTEFRDLALQQKQQESNLHVPKPNLHMVADLEDRKVS
jgi:glutathione synthase/RimK-type ligase-like ATP-grasp enzyme